MFGIFYDPRDPTKHIFWREFRAAVIAMSAWLVILQQPFFWLYFPPGCFLTGLGVVWFRDAWRIRHWRRGLAKTWALKKDPRLGFDDIGRYEFEVGGVRVEGQMYIGSAVPKHGVGQIRRENSHYFDAEPPHRGPFIAVYYDPTDPYKHRLFWVRPMSDGVGIFVAGVILLAMVGNYATLVL